MADKEKRNPSIVDVAQKAGVSAGTVSRVINSNPKISAATVKRVVSAMDDLGYQPPHPTRRRGKSSRAQQGIHNNQIAVVPLNTGPRLNRSPLITKTPRPPAGDSRSEEDRRRDHRRTGADR